MCIDGLPPALSVRVANYNENNQKVSYLDVIDFSKAGSGTLRAKQKALGPPVKELAKLQALMIAETDAAFISSFNAELLAASVVRESLNNLFTGRQQDKTVSNASMNSSAEENPALVMIRHARQCARISKGPAIPGLYPRQRVGWINRAIQTAIERTVSPLNMGLICHECYKLGQIAPNCILSLYQLRLVASKYKALTLTERWSASSTIYYKVFKTFNLSSHAAASESDSSTNMVSRQNLDSHVVKLFELKSFKPPWHPAFFTAYG